MITPFTRAPHQGVGGPVGSGAPNAALLIDFDNVTMGMRSDLSKDLKKLLQSDIIRGKVTVQRAYADWRRYPQYIVPLSEASIDLIFAPAYGSSKKNATDIRMAIDAVELVFVRPEIGTFILLTGDSDFSSLVLKLKEYGKYVIGVGIQESSSDILVQNCDEYYSYTTVTGLRKTSESDRTAVDPWVLVEKAVTKMAERDDVMRSDRLKQVMIEIDPGFNEGDFGYSKFSRFLAEAASKGLVQLRKLENGQYEVAPSTGGGGRGDGRRGRREEGQGERSRGGSEREVRGRGRGEHKEQDRKEPSRGESSPRAEALPPAEAASRAEVAPRVEPAKPPEAGAPVEPTAGPEVRTQRQEVREGGGPLHAAYTLLRRAMESLREQGRDTIRDSDVKRKMLELDSSFDEAELGFGKFSRFLRQAHDHEVVDLHKQEGGNYEVSLGGASPSGREVERGSSRAAPEGTRAPEAQRREAPAGEPTPRGSPGAAEGRTEPRMPTAPAGLGPRRGSTRRRRDEGPPLLLEGQALPAGREATSTPVDPEALGLPTEAEAQILYLTNSYRGVGRKTAEALVEGFGNDLYTVLQNEPRRLEDVVPTGRAEQVLEAWRADYERRLARGDSLPHERPSPSMAPSGPTAETPGEAGDDVTRGASPRRRTRRGGRRGGRNRGG